MPHEDELTPRTGTELKESREELECAKLRAEAAKLDAEAALARRPFLKSVGFYSALVPIVLALASLPFSIKLFQADWKLLEYDTRKLTEEKIASRNAVATAKAELSEVQAKYRGALRVLALVQQQLTNAVAMADTATNKVASALLTELRRVEEQRDAITQAFLKLKKEPSHLTVDSDRVTVDSTNATADGRVFLLTEDGHFLTTEDGKRIVLEDVFVDGEGRVFSDAFGKPFTQGTMPLRTNRASTTNAPTAK